MSRTSQLRLRIRSVEHLASGEGGKVTEGALALNPPSEYEKNDWLAETTGFWGGGQVRRKRLKPHFLTSHE